jgi:hypothetical protein
MFLHLESQRANVDALSYAPYSTVPDSQDIMLYKKSPRTSVTL